MSLATIIKGSDQDFRNIFGIPDGNSAYSKIRESGDKILIYTRGAGGAELFTPDLHLEVPARKTNVISTIGAGDNFSAGTVFGLFKKLTNNLTLSNLSLADWEEIMNFGTLFASEVCASSQNYLPVEFGEKLISAAKK